MRGSRVADMWRDVDNHVHCDVGAVWLELRDGEDEEGRKEGGE